MCDGAYDCSDGSDENECRKLSSPTIDYLSCQNVPPQTFSVKLPADLNVLIIDWCVMELMTVPMVLMKMSAISYLPYQRLSHLLECPPSDFQCQTPGRLECIDNRLVCDGGYDYSDGSDENDCRKLSPLL